MRLQTDWIFCVDWYKVGCKPQTLQRAVEGICIKAPRAFDSTIKK